MNKLFIFIIALTTSISAYAANGGVQTTFVPNMEMKELQNKVYYNYLLEAYNTNKEYSDGLIKCAKKNKYYLPTHPGADADDCYDVIAYLESIAITGTTTTYQGLQAVPGGRVPTGIGEGVFAADEWCNISHPGSRAARYEDIKYLMQKGNISFGGDNVLVFEGVRDIDGIIDVGVSSGEFKDLSFTIADGACDEYRSISNSHGSRRYEPDATPRFIQEMCTEQAQIVCVSD